MPKITFLPMNKTVEAKTGETVLDVALANDIDIPHACGGNGACGMCMVVLKEGTLSEKDEDTEGIFAMEDNERLACIAKVENDDAVIELS